MADFNTTFIISLVVIATGYLLKRARIVDENGGGKALAGMIFYVTLPAVIIRALTTVTIDPDMIAMPLIVPLVAGITIPVVLLVHRKEAVKTDRGLFLMMSLGFNVGNFGFPLIHGIFGDEGIKYAAMFDIGNAVVIFCVCYVIAVLYSAKEGQRVQPRIVARKVFTSPPLLAYLVGLVMNAAGAGLPVVASDIVDVIAQSNHFVTYFVLGVYLNFHIETRYWKAMFKVLGIRYIVGIGLGVSFFLFLPIGEVARTVLLVCLLLPVGMALLIFVVEYGYNERFAGMLSNFNIVISFALIWLVLFILNLQA